MRTARSLLALAPLGLLVLATACGRGPGDDRRLTITGSSTVAPLVGELARRFEALHPGVRIDVQTGGSSRGIADVRSGLADLGMVSRDLRPGEDDLVAFALAADGVGVIVHRDRPIAGLTTAQLTAIYAGAVDDWSAVDGPAGPITVVHKADGRATQEVFLGHLGLAADRIVPDVVIGDNEQGIKIVAGNPGAIGYVSIGTAEVDIENGVPIRLVDLDGVAARTATVADRTYPLARTLHLVATAAPDGLARAFVDHATGGENDDLVLGQAFVPLRR